jgi:hypothetical protein
MTSSSNKAILADPQRVQELLRIATSTKSYYDSLTQEQIEEARAWGLFAAAQFTSEDEDS